MRRKILVSALTTAMAFSGWTAVTFSNADAAVKAVPKATCRVSEGPGGRFGVSGKGFRAGERITVRNSKGKTVRVTKAITGGFFEVTGLPNGNYRATGRTATASCPKFVPDDDGAIKCTVTKGPGKTYGVSGRGFPEGEKVTLKNSKGAVVDTTVTIKDGFFEFTGVPNGTYTVTSTFAHVTCPKAT